MALPTGALVVICHEEQSKPEVRKDLTQTAWNGKPGTHRANSAKLWPSFLSIFIWFDQVTKAGIPIIKKNTVFII